MSYPIKMHVTLSSGNVWMQPLAESILCAVNNGIVWTATLQRPVGA